LKKSIKFLQSNGNVELPSVLPTPRAVRSHTVRTLANWLVLSSRDSRAIDFLLKSRVSTPEITFREKLIFQCLFDGRPPQETILTKTLAETNTQTKCNRTKFQLLGWDATEYRPSFFFSVIIY
jgi:hypothetical protein